MVLVIPRHPVPLFRLFWKMGGWSVIILGVLLLILSLISQANLSTAKRFEKEGRKATAIVTERYTTVSTDSDGDRTTTYWLTLDYVTQAGEEISLNRSVGTAAYNRASEGQPFDLLYLDSQPRKTELTEGSYRQSSRVLQVVALVEGVMFLGLLWLIGGWTVSAARARRYGRREEAVVREVRRTNIRVNNRPRFRLVWEDSAGREGKSLLRKKSDLAGFRPGDHIDIYHGLKRSWWVGDIGERPEFSK